MLSIQAVRGAHREKGEGFHMAIPSQNWISNHLRVASRLTTTIKAYAQRQRMDVDDVLASLDSDNWRMFATLAGCEPHYTPSDETRLIVLELVRHEAQRACIGCGLRQGTRQAGKGGRAGVEFCEPCWRQEFAENDAEAAS